MNKQDGCTRGKFSNTIRRKTIVKHDRSVNINGPGQYIKWIYIVYFFRSYCSVKKLKYKIKFNSKVIVKVVWDAYRKAIASILFIRYLCQVKVNNILMIYNDYRFIWIHV